MKTQVTIYEPYPYPALFYAAREDVLGLTTKRHAVLIDRMDGPIGALGLWAAHAYDLNEPQAGIMHRDVRLTEHTDTMNPYPCVNLVVYYRAHMAGGHLLIGDDELACADGWVAVFDGQRPHATTALEPKTKGAYRVGVTFYCPR